MTARVEIQFAVPAEVRRAKDGSACFTSVCPPLDVFSQGETEDAALANLAEALRLFIESCYERGTLAKVLKECGFEPDGNDREVGGRREGQRVVRVSLPLVAQAG